MKRIALLLMLFLPLVISCTKEPGTITLKESSEPVVESMNDFGMDLFRHILAEEPDEKNLFISPTSISLALAMTLNGADNETADSMAFALRMDELESGQINETYRDLIAGLTSCDPKVVMEIANSIWYRLGFSVEQDFLDVNDAYYQAEVTELDFNSEEAIPTINDWVSDKTHDKIPAIIDRIDATTLMFLINAIYFKGTWTMEFDKKDTYEGDFYLSDESPKTVEMMQLEEEISYLENDYLQACELDYGRGNFSMVVILPKTDMPMDSLLDLAVFSEWNVLISSFQKREITLSLPKFKFDYEIVLNDILAAMGMGNAFGLTADFSKINPYTQLFISYVKHKTFVDVNEEGTEAAAATIVAMNFMSAGKYMTVNRPFFFAIREKTTNTIVFMGRVSDPDYE